MRPVLGSAALALGLATLIVACGGHSWPEEIERNFLDSCTHEAKTQRPNADAATVDGYCHCALEQMRLRYSAEDFGRIEEEMRRSGIVPEDQIRLVAPCVERFQR
jgi:hypothetical protein